MKSHFDFLRIIRQNTLNLISNFTDEQLNQTPNGFNNNMVWNLGHLVATQQLLHYGLAGLPFIIDQSIIDRYRKGTQPEGIVGGDEIGELKELMLTCVDQLETDYNNGIFKSFKTYPTSFNAILNSIEDSITFNNIHEGLHLGYMMAMKRCL